MIGRIVGKVFAICGYNVQVERIRKKKTVVKNPCKINIGAADWYKEGWTNLDYPTEHYAKRQAQTPFIPYDIRNDRLPFENGTISLAYCSHVIEHIEDRYIHILFEEVYRSLKSGGVFRITCPDASYLYDVTKLKQKSYWNWRKDWFSRNYSCNWEDVNSVDCLVAEIATERCDVKQENKDYIKKFEEMSKNEYLEWITNGLEFDNQKVGNHINYWTCEKLEKMLREVGFQNIIFSKYGGSVVDEMQDRKYFDVTHPEMSLYVEAIK